MSVDSGEVAATEIKKEEVSIEEASVIESELLDTCERADDFVASDSVVTGQEDSRNDSAQVFEDDTDASTEKQVEQNQEERKMVRNNRRRGKGRQKRDVNSYCNENIKKGVMQYSRKEMEDLRFVNLDEQKKKWIQTYCGLEPTVVREYDRLVKSDKGQQKPSILGPYFDPRIHFHESTSLGGSVSNISDEIGSFDADGGQGKDDETDEDDYSSLQRPAFFVSGDPDFDSEAPQDGLEYLRRVRWEAARIPKVVRVSGLDKSKEQSVYMPRIPDIEKCSENLLPLREWEHSFLKEFSGLREVVARRLEGDTSNEGSVELQPQDDLLVQQLEETSDSEFCCISEISDADIQSTHSPEGVDHLPTLSSLRKMSPAARMTMLKKRINSIQDASVISRNDSLWLFSLCAAVDCPLDGDAAAAIRSLLRKCCSLRAAKSEVDDEVVVLNILVTISGLYFGQQEK